MNDFAFYLSLNEIGYFKGIIKNMPKEILDIHVHTDPGGVGDLLPESRGNIDGLLDDKYNVLPFDPAKLQRYKFAVMSSYFYGKAQEYFDWKKDRRSGLACLYHATDAPVRINYFAASHYILAHQRQAQSLGKNQIVKDKNPELFRQAMALPRQMINEYAYTGLYHLGEWEEKRHAPKAQLRTELEQKLQCSLPDDKPVVAFLQDEVSHLCQVTKALEALAPHVTLVIKGPSIPDIDGAYFWKDRGLAPNLLRFAADYILAGYHSGTLASSTMLGLRVIPYYTSLIHFGGRRLGKLDKYTRYLPGHFTDDNVCVDIIQNINPPVDLLDTPAVLDRISDESWWVRYAQGLPEAQKTIFGDYAISGAASKTARLLIRACGQGSFGEDVTTIGLRPEFRNF